jgi:hypothetical protein
MIIRDLIELLLKVPEEERDGEIDASYDCGCATGLHGLERCVDKDNKVSFTLIGD